MDSPEISDVFMTAASRSDVKAGLIGYVKFRLGIVTLDCVAIRRTRAGTLTLSFPERRDRAGRAHPYIRPVDCVARLQVETQVFEALGIAEETP